MTRGHNGHGVLFLAFDAGSPRLVREWAAAGHLPHFARLLAQGATATVEHEPGLFVGSIWPTALTGIGVDRHGCYTGIRPAPLAYEYTPAGPEADPLWVDAARSGRRIAVVDAPFFPAVEGLDGVQLVEWGCHDRYYGPHSEPPELLGDVVRDVGVHPIGMTDHVLGYERFAPCDGMHMTDGTRTPDDVVAFIHTLADAVEHRMQLSKYLLDRGPFDLTVHIVGETHCAGHHLWSLHDTTHPDHDAALVERLGGDPLLEVYRGMDALLGRHLEAMDDEGTAYVFLSHGMQSHFSGTSLLDEVLWRLDQAYRGLPTPWVGPRTRRAADLLRRVPNAARGRTLAAARPLVRRWLAGRDSDEATAIPSPAERLWYQLENNTVSGALRFNRAGREPQGLLSEALSEHALDWLRRELALLVNVDSGGPVIADVYAAEEHYQRRDEDGLPDVLIEWERDEPIDRVWSPTIGLVSRPYEGIRTGDHNPFGELIAFGPGITPGRRAAIRPIDVAPTVAAAAGVFLPDRDGHPIAGFLPGPAGPAHEAQAARDEIAALERSPARDRPSDVDTDAALRRELIALRHRLQGLEAAHHATRQMVDTGRASAEILSTTAWIRQQDVAAGERFSVVLPTRNRLDRLQHAVRSVLDQTYGAFELIVVDDASSDGTAAWLATLTDPRVRVVRNEEQQREGGARNAALDTATGDIVTFLDDDNTWDRDWLRSLAWLFQEHPSTQVAYGARIVDDAERHHGRPSGGLPSLELNDWDRVAQATRCLVDMNVVAHRPGPTRFDPTLPIYTDWDYLLGLTADIDPFRLPVIAAHYTTSAPDRATDLHRDDQADVYARVRRRWGHDA